MHHSIEDINDVISKDIKRVFKIINQKQELIPIFKYYAGIAQEELIEKKRMPLDSFRQFLEEVQKERYNKRICSEFFSQIQADNIFKFGNRLYS